MANETVVRVTADASGYTSEMERARKSAADFVTSQETVRQRLATAATAIDNSRKALKEQGDAALDAFNKSAKSAERWLSGLQKQASEAGKTREELMRLRAAELGVSEAAEKYIAQIEAASNGSRKITEAVNGVGISAKQTAAAMRMVPAQMTDIVTQLAGGQSPLLILTQQGGQLKDMFGGIGPAARALGTYISALITPVTVLGAAIAGSAYLGYSAREELAEYGDNIEKLHQKTGVSTDAIQQWAFAAKTAGIDTKDATKSLSALGEVQNKATSGNKDAAKTFAALGISMSDLKKDSPEQLLPKIADAFSGTADNAAKAAIANELFGSSGADLIPLLNKGKVGLDELKGAAGEAGAVIGGDTVEQMAGLKEQMDTSKAKMDAMSNSAKTKLLPTILNLTNAMGDNVAMKPLLEDFYKGVAVIMKTAASAVATLVVGFEQTGKAIGAVGAVVALAIQGDFSGAVAAAKAGIEDIKVLGKGYSDFMGKIWSDDAPSTPKKSRVGLPSLPTLGGNEKKAPKEKAYQDDAATKFLEQLRDQDAALRAEISSTEKLAGAEKALAEFQQKIADWSKKDKLTAEQKSLIAAQDKIKAQFAINIEHEKEKKHLEDINKLQERSAQINAQITNYQTSSREQYDRQLSAIGLGSEAQKNAEAVKSIYKEYEKLQWQLEKETPKSLIGSDKYNEEKAQIQSQLKQSLKDYSDYYDALKAKQADWKNGASEAISNYVDSTKNMLSQVGNVFNTALKGIENMMLSFFNTGKLGWQDFAKAILIEIEKIVIAKEVAGLVSFASGFFGFGGSTSTSSGSVTSGSPSFQGFGGAGSDYAPYSFAISGTRATGGPVNSGSTYLVGENGPELFTPGQSGSIVPNNALTGGGGGVVIQQSFYIQQDGSVKQTGNAGEYQQVTQQMADAMTGIARQSIVKAMLPGGEIATVYGNKL